ncbi:hypothetical protein ACPW96_22290 [Micromonospora sp. DT81.3]|uniref:DUF7882 family protein n=1 Tax=Micromonospora sp. DT81.3 TaxID=3416523 RepID=UPI003CEDA607
MGMFRYGEILRAEFEDRTLWHVQWVIGAKICRGESFHFSWKDAVSLGSGRTTVWIHPNCSIVFKFDRGNRPPLSAAWLKDLMSTANSHSGLYVTPEPATLDTELRDSQNRTDTPQH